MKCRDCPLVKDEFNRRMSCYHNGLYDELGWYDGYSEEDVADDNEQFCWCEKTGGKMYVFGQCSDAYDDILIPPTNRSKQKKRNKRERDLKYKQRLKFLTENVQCYPCPVIYTNEIWIKGYGYVENPKPYYKRLYRDNHKGGRYKYYKKHSNRQVRKYKGELHSKGNQYRKVFDYWWAVN